MPIHSEGALDLAQFILDRLDDDRRIYEQFLAEWSMTDADISPDCLLLVDTEYRDLQIPAWRLREETAGKRQIVKDCMNVIGHGMAAESWAFGVLCSLARGYAAHESFRPEWARNGR